MQVVFRTPFFQPIDGEDRETNPGVYGKALARWLAEALAARGITAHDVIPEDFGWVVMVSRDPCLLWYGCGNVEGSTDTWRSSRSRSRPCCSGCSTAWMSTRKPAAWRCTCGRWCRPFRR